MSLQILKNKREIVAAREKMRGGGIDCADGALRSLLKRLRLVPGQRLGDRIKSWDVLRTLHFVTQRLDSADAVLDLGAYASELLPALNRSGFTRLTGIDLNPSLSATAADCPITYLVGDFYQSGLPAASFTAITAISVIEHGFDSGRLLSEVSRLLQQGGYFIASVDYWHDKIDTGGVKAFGLDWMIFSQPDMEKFLSEAALSGLVPVGELDFATEQAPIRWLGRSYTFAWFALQKAAAPS